MGHPLRLRLRDRLQLVNVPRLQTRYVGVLRFLSHLAYLFTISPGDTFSLAFTSARIGSDDRMVLIVTLIVETLFLFSTLTRRPLCVASVEGLPHELRVSPHTLGARNGTCAGSQRLSDGQR